MAISVIECTHLPATPDPAQAYRLVPVAVPEEYYWERVDRNLGWITRAEQAMLRRAKIGIAGCGGMGGLLAQIFFRLGVGEVRIADPEVFDISNIGRQFAARRDTVGKSKAMETAIATRAIVDDASLVVYPQGIAADAVNDFLAGCDVVCDEIEFWAVSARILLHQRARSMGIDVFNCNTVGFGTRLFFFEPQGFTMEEMLGFNLGEATVLQEKIQRKTASPEEIQKVMQAVLAGLVPELPEYSPDDPEFHNHEQARKRLIEEGRAMIISTNPPMAAGFLADRVLLRFLEKKSTIRRSVAALVPAPGYLYFDAAFMQAKQVRRKEPL